MMALIDKMIGQPLFHIGRAVDMLCVSFGEIVEMDIKGFGLSRYEIHCQCAWRITDASGQLLVASTDIYAPPTNMKWTPSFHWDKKNGNLFDERVTVLLKECLDVKLEKLQILQHNDLLVTFSNGFLLTTFTDTTTEECWRIFERGKDYLSLVATSNELSVI